MKLITILITLNLALFADLTSVKTFYDNGEYKKAVSEAKISTDDYSNPELHLLWAKSAEKLGSDDEAMSAYERVEILDENNIEARVSLVKLYKRTGRYDLASSASKDLQNYQLTPEQRTVLDNLRGIDVHSFKAFASLGIGYDSNINVAPDKLGVVVGVDPISTMFARLSASGSYINELEDKGGWYARGDLQVYNQTNFDSDAELYDLFLGALKGGIGYAQNDYNIYIPVGYDTIHYLDTNLLSQIKVEPKLNYTLSNQLILNATMSYISRSYQEDALKNRDDSSVGLGLGVYYLFDKNFLYLNAKYDKFSLTDSASTATYVDKSYLTSNMGVNYNIATWLVARGDYRFRLGSYDDNGRSDFYNQVEVKLSHYFMNNFEAYLSDRYIKNSSNETNYEYSKNILMFGVSANY